MRRPWISSTFDRIRAMSLARGTFLGIDRFDPPSSSPFLLQELTKNPKRKKIKEKDYKINGMGYTTHNLIWKTA